MLLTLTCYQNRSPQSLKTWRTEEQVVESDCSQWGKDMGHTQGHYQITRSAQKPHLPPGIIASFHNPRGLICQHSSFPVWLLSGSRKALWAGCKCLGWNSSSRGGRGRMQQRLTAGGGRYLLCHPAKSCRFHLPRLGLLPEQAGWAQPQHFHMPDALQTMECCLGVLSAGSIRKQAPDFLVSWGLLVRKPTWGVVAGSSSRQGS